MDDLGPSTAKQHDLACDVGRWFVRRLKRYGRLETELFEAEGERGVAWLVRYLARPPFVEAQLEWRDDGQDDRSAGAPGWR